MELQYINIHPQDNYRAHNTQKSPQLKKAEHLKVSLTGLRAALEDNYRTLTQYGNLDEIRECSIRLLDASYQANKLIDDLIAHPDSATEKEADLEKLSKTVKTLESEMGMILHVSNTGIA